MNLIYLTSDLLATIIRLMLLAALLKVAYNYFKVTYFMEIKKVKSFLGKIADKFKKAVKHRPIKTVAFEVVK